MTTNTQQKFLPIDTAEGFFLDPKKAREFGEERSAGYRSADPYPHIVMDDFLPVDLAENILRHFPAASAERHAAEHALNYPGIQKNKRQVYPNDCDAFCRNLFGFFNAAPFLELLEGLTGIQGLIPDPYFNGGGFHEISPGGKLGIHADFRLNERLHVSRRLNVLIYLNKDWHEDFGGYLELWDRSMKQNRRSIAPIFNRCVVFNTDADSYHGHPEPLHCPPDRTRKSIALYYYTASKAIYSEVPSSSTMYVSRPGENSYTRKQAIKLRFQNYAKDLLPPIVFRKLRQLKQTIK